MKHFFKNQKADLMQKTAWRLVRSAEDRFPDLPGAQKLQWCVERMRQIHPGISDEAEDHIRSAFMNFKVEHSAIKRSIA